jgi:SAM-dependent methyltransferase
MLVQAPGKFAVLKCEDCELAFTWPRLEGHDFNVYYPVCTYPSYRSEQGDGRGGSFDRLIKAIAQRRRDRWLGGGPYEHLLCQPPGKLLDVGCGVGHQGGAFIDRGWEVWGVEPSPAAAEQARIRGLHVHTGTLTDSGFDDEMFDAVILNHSLEHIPEPAGTLTTLNRLLRPGGVLAIAVPNYDCWQRKLFGSNWFHLDLPRHLQHFTAETLERIVRSAGLDSVVVSTYSSMNGLPNSVQYALAGRLIVPDQGMIARVAAVLYRVLHRLYARVPGDHLFLTARL